MIRLTQEERDKFLAWLDDEAKVNRRLALFLAEMPTGTNGATLRDRASLTADAATLIGENLRKTVYVS